MLLAHVTILSYLYLFGIQIVDCGRYSDHCLPRSQTPLTAQGSCSCIAFCRSLAYWAHQHAGICTKQKAPRRSSSCAGMHAWAPCTRDLQAAGRLSDRSPTLRYLGHLSHLSLHGNNGGSRRCRDVKRDSVWAEGFRICSVATHRGSRVVALHFAELRDVA